MHHLLFPSEDHAAAFAQDLMDQGTPPDALRRSVQVVQETHLVEEHFDAETPAQGAVSGAGAGALLGAGLGMIATVATGGAALPLMLGLAALGAGTGAVGGAVEGTVEQRHAEHLARMNEQRRAEILNGLQGGESGLAVEEHIPEEVVRAAAARHGGRVM